MIRPLPLFLLALAAALPLCACGKQGALERPEPNSQYSAEQKAKTDQARENADAAKPGEPSPPVMPARSAPMPGAKPDPSGSAPPGVLPDPYARPQ